MSEDGNEDTSDRELPDDPTRIQPSLTEPPDAEEAVLWRRAAEGLLDLKEVKADRAGWLLKLGRYNNKLQWRERYAVLHFPFLFYFRSPNPGQKALGSIFLRMAEFNQVERHIQRQLRYCLMINTSVPKHSATTFNTISALAFKTQEDLKEWLACMNESGGEDAAYPADINSAVSSPPPATNPSDDMTRPSKSEEDTVVTSLSPNTDFHKEVASYLEQHSKDAIAPGTLLSKLKKVEMVPGEKMHYQKFKPQQLVVEEDRAESVQSLSTTVNTPNPVDAELENHRLYLKKMREEMERSYAQQKSSEFVTTEIARLQSSIATKNKMYEELHRKEHMNGMSLPPSVLRSAATEAGAAPKILPTHILNNLEGRSPADLKDEVIALRAALYEREREVETMEKKLKHSSRQDNVINEEEIMSEFLGAIHKPAQPKILHDAQQILNHLYSLKRSGVLDARQSLSPQQDRLKSPRSYRGASYI